MKATENILKMERSVMHTEDVPCGKERIQQNVSSMRTASVPSNDVLAARVCDNATQQWIMKALSNCGMQNEFRLIFLHSDIF